MLTLEVDTIKGEDIRGIIEEMCLLASRTGCMIRTDLNGVATMIKPGADPRNVYGLWEIALESKHHRKVICGEPVTIARDKPWGQPSSDQGKELPQK